MVLQILNTLPSPLLKHEQPMRQAIISSSLHWYMSLSFSRGCWPKRPLRHRWDWWLSLISILREGWDENHLGQQAAPGGCGQPARPLVGPSLLLTLVAHLNPSSLDLLLPSLAALLVPDQGALPPIHHLQQHQAFAEPPLTYQTLPSIKLSKLTKPFTLPDCLSRWVQIPTSTPLSGSSGCPLSLSHLLPSPSPVTLSPSHLCHLLSGAESWRWRHPPVTTRPWTSHICNEVLAHMPLCKVPRTKCQCVGPIIPRKKVAIFMNPSQTPHYNISTAYTINTK